jgi:hypothetical protein
MERCLVCGRSYGITHSCPGTIAIASVGPRKWPVPSGFHPLQYFRQALAIARLDDAAVMTASTDKNALLYGSIIWILGQLLIIAGSLWGRASALARLNWVAVALTLLFLVLMDAILILAQYGICHLLARWWFGARGTYAKLLRPLLLGSVVTWLGVLPFVGIIVAGLWSVAVMMIVFEEVDGIDRLKAFGLSFVIGLIFQALMSGLFTPR